jgi:hypothetical protein
MKMRKIEKITMKLAEQQMPAFVCVISPLESPICDAAKHS